MDGQLSLFPEEQNPPANKKKKQKDSDLSKTFDERMKRFLHYMKTGNQRWRPKE